MDNFDRNKLESIYLCGFGYWAVLKQHLSTAQQPKPQK